MHIHLFKSLGMFAAEKLQLFSVILFWIYYNFVNVFAYLQISNAEQNTINVFDLLSIERVGSTGLLIVAIWWTVREMKIKEKIFLDQIAKMKDLHKEEMEKKEKQISELIQKLIDK